MNAIDLLRQMHADTKIRFKLILGLEDPMLAATQWQALQPMLQLHEQLEDQFVYTPLSEEMGPGTPLGDWDIQHEADVAVVKQLIAASDQANPATPEWRMSVARVMDALSKHVMDEEGQIFGRIEQIWAPERLEEAGAQMQALMDGSAAPARRAATTSVKPARTRITEKTATTRRH